MVLDPTLSFIGFVFANLLSISHEVHIIRQIKSLIVPNMIKSQSYAEQFRCNSALNFDYLFLYTLHVYSIFKVQFLR